MNKIRWKKIFSILFFSFGILFCLVVSGSYMFLDNISRKEITPDFKNHAILSDRYWPKYLEDVRTVKRVSFFADKKTLKNDAAGTINPYITWMSSYNHLKKRRLLSNEFIEKYSNASPEDLFNQKFYQYSKPFDFSWMSELKNYDHWSNEYVIEDLRDSKNKVARIYSYPYPDFDELKSWINLRLAKGIHENKFKKALNDINHVARLLYTQDYIISAMMAVSIVKIQREALNQYNKIKNTQLSVNWKLPTLSELETIKKVVWTSKDIVSIATPKKIRLSLANENSDALLCAGLSEEILNQIASKALLENVEQKNYKITSIMIKKASHCQNDHIVHYWKNIKFKSIEQYYNKFNKIEFAAVKYLIKIPYFRNLYGRLLHPALANSYSLYNAQSSQSTSKHL